jgi:hypothetical protein
LHLGKTQARTTYRGHTLSLRWLLGSHSRYCLRFVVIVGRSFNLEGKERFGYTPNGKSRLLVLVWILFSLFKPGRFRIA